MTGDELDREFWLIIMTTWSLNEISALGDYAEAVEKSINW